MGLEAMLNNIFDLNEKLDGPTLVNVYSTKILPNQLNAYSKMYRSNKTPESRCHDIFNCLNEHKLKT